MIKDNKNTELKNITLRQDKYLWIAREYQKQKIDYIEIADSDLVKANGPAIKLIEEVHQIMPYIEKETGVKIRLLAAMRRIPITIIASQIKDGNYLRENLDVLKTVAKSPYVVGSDFMGEEINDISDLKPAIKELVEYVADVDNDFTIRIHAGENDSLRDNVAKSIECIKEALKPGQKMPKVRLGHGLYTADLNSEEGKKLIKELKEGNVVLEFQLTSNVRLNNLSNLSLHPIKTYLKNGIKCVQGTDGCGFYGVDTIDEQLALQNLLGLTDEDFQAMRKVEDEIIEDREKYFKKKSAEFEKFLNGRTITEALTQLEKENIEKGKKNNQAMRINNNIESEVKLRNKIKQLPENKIKIIKKYKNYGKNRCPCHRFFERVYNRHPGIWLLLAGGKRSLCLTAGIDKGKTDRNTYGVNFNRYDGYHKTYTRAVAEDRLKHRETKKADGGRTTDKGRYGRIGYAVLVEPTEYKVHQEETCYKHHKRYDSELDINAEHLAVSLYD